MLSNIKKYLERGIIAAVTAMLLCASLVSWSIMIDEAQMGTNESIVVDAKETSSQIKRGSMIFAGTMLVVVEYFKND